jgi:integrase
VLSVASKDTRPDTERTNALQVFNPESPVSVSRRTKPRRKRAKREELPIWQRSDGRWCRKIRGEFHYFGRDKEAALAEWERTGKYLLEGKEPPPEGQPAEGVTVKFLADSFLRWKKQQRESGEIGPRTFSDLHIACLRIADAFGRGRLVSDLRPDDFRELRRKLAAKLGPVALGNEISRVRSIFRFGQKDGLLESEVRFGTGFDKPTAKSVRIDKAKRGRMDLQAEQVRKLIQVAGVPLKAMVLLGINCGFGNADCGTLPLSAVDLEGGWISYSRPKTGVSRRAKLWKETVTALKAAIAERPQPKDSKDAGLAFITCHGASWAKGAAGNDPVCGEFKKLLVDLGMHRDGLGFYSLRRTYRTVADNTGDEAPDVRAIDLTMGHGAKSGDMAGSHYIQNISDKRLEAVANHVREWVFGLSKAKTRKNARTA